MKHLALSIVAAAIVIFPTFSPAFEAGFGRISMINGEALVKTQESDEWFPASVNIPLYEGDSIWSPDGSRVEIQLRNGTYLRLDDRSSMEILALDKDFQQFHLGMGHAYVRAEKIGADGLQIDLDDTSIKVYGKARFRVDNSGEGGEEVSLFKGDAYVEGNSGNTRLRSGEMLTVEGNSSELSPLNPSDEWERWNRDRDRTIAGRNGGSRYLPEELTVYASDLDANGEWVESPEYGRVWRPTVIVPDDWSPYRVGRWVERGDDYIWVSQESWGWAPYHYGRWVVIPDRGWCWVPPARADVFWAPGYVGWVTTPTYVGWVPLAPGEVYYGRGYYGRRSVNITTVNSSRNSISNVTNITNVTYRNVAVTNAVTVVDKESFAAGRVERVKVRENIFARKNAALGVPAVKPVGRQAVRPVSPAKLPPARLTSVPVRELRERHPRLAERPVGTPPLNKRAHPVSEQGRFQNGRGLSGRPGTEEKTGAEQPRPLPSRERPATLPPPREKERRNGDNAGAPLQRETPTQKGEDRQGNRTGQAKRPTGESPESNIPGEEKARKAWNVKEKEQKEPDKIDGNKERHND